VTHHDEPADDPVRSGDLDQVLRLIDTMVDDNAWPDLEALRQRCLVAFERGHQLWPAADAAAYRLALHAPASYAVTPVVDDSVRFSIGPLTEVIAENHPWSELAPLLPAGPARSAVAQERVVRGDDLTQLRDEIGAVGPALTLLDWEPDYVTATYAPFEADFGEPPGPELSVRELPKLNAGDQPSTSAGDDVTAALLAVTATWVEQSTGRAEAAAVAGTAEHAIAALGVPGIVAADITVAEAMAALAWAGANGGAHGRRRGMAAGRFEAWWTLAAATNLIDEWPVDPDLLGEAARELRWVRWHPRGPRTGWELHLAVEDPLDGLAWAVAATDHRL